MPTSWCDTRIDELKVELARLTAELEIAQGQVEHTSAYLGVEIKERERLTAALAAAVAEAARLRTYNAGLAKIGADLEAERDVLRAAFDAFATSIGGKTSLIIQRRDPSWEAWKKLCDAFAGALVP